MPLACANESQRKLTRNFADIVETSRGTVELVKGVDPPAYLGGGGSQTRTTIGQVRECAHGPVLGANTQ